MVLKYKDNRDILIRRSVMQLLPILASYNTNVFVSSYLHPSMTYLLNQLKKEKDRSIGTRLLGSWPIHNIHSSVSVNW